MPVVIHYNQPPIVELDILQGTSPSQPLDDLILIEILREIKSLRDELNHQETAPIIQPVEVSGTELICITLQDGTKRRVSINTLRKFSQIYIAPDGTLFQSTVDSAARIKLDDEFVL